MALHQIGAVFGDEFGGIHLQVGSGIAEFATVLKALYHFALQGVMIA